MASSCAARGASLAAICMGGQIRSASLEAPADSFIRHVLRPLGADLFMYLGPQKPDEVAASGSAGIQRLLATAARVAFDVEEDAGAFIRRVPGLEAVLRKILARYPTGLAREHGSWLGGLYLPATELGPAVDMRDVHGHAAQQYISHAWCLQMMREFEDGPRCGRRYEHFVWTRPDYLWHFDHPPPALWGDADASEEGVWIPDFFRFGGLNDRHAAMPRRVAEIYLGTWSLLRDGTSSIQDVLTQTRGRLTPEQWLVLRLGALGVPTFEFPMIAHEACVEPSADGAPTKSREYYCDPAWASRSHEELVHARAHASCLRARGGWNTAAREACLEAADQAWRKAQLWRDEFGRPWKAAATLAAAGLRDHLVPLIGSSRSERSSESEDGVWNACEPIPVVPLAWTDERWPLWRLPLFDAILVHGAALSPSSASADSLPWPAARQPQVEGLAADASHTRSSCAVRGLLFEALLHVAAASGHAEVARALVSSAAPDRMPMRIGRSALHTAAEAGNVQVVEVLLEHRSAIDVLDEMGRTALHAAAAEGHTTILRQLLQHGDSFIMARDTSGATAADVAATAGMREAAELLAAAAIDIEANVETSLTTAVAAAPSAAAAESRPPTQRWRYRQRSHVDSSLGNSASSGQLGGKLAHEETGGGGHQRTSRLQGELPRAVLSAL